MSLYRSLLVGFTALALTLPAFADEAATTGTEPAAQPTQATAAQATADATQQAKVDVNKATLKDLAQVKGLSPAKAKAIIAYRKKNGDFKSLDDLVKVKGFKKLNNDQLKAIQDQLTAG